MGPYQQALLGAYYNMSDAFENIYCQMFPGLDELVENPFPSRPRCALCGGSNINGSCFCVGALLMTVDEIIRDADKEFQASPRERALIAEVVSLRERLASGETALCLQALEDIEAAEKQVQCLMAPLHEKTQGCTSEFVPCVACSVANEVARLREIEAMYGGLCK